MVRRVRMNEFKLARIIGRAVLGNPESGNLKMLVPQHVEQWNLADDGAEKIGALRKGRAHQQATVAAALDRQVCSVSESFRDQVLRSRNEVVKDVLLVFQHAGAVPAFSKFVATAQLNVNIHAAMFQQKEHDIAVEERCATHVEAAITGKKGWVAAIAPDALLADDEHGNARAVFGSKPVLLNLVFL